MKKWLAGIIVALGVATLLPMLVLCLWVQPVCDDFVYALREQSAGIFTSAVETYVNWSGRYFATFISHINPLAHGGDVVLHYKLLLATIIALTPVVMWLSFRLLLRDVLSRGETALLALFMVVVYVAQCPSMSQMFYWFSSVMAYTVPTLLALMLMCSLRHDSLWWRLVQSLLAIAAIGGNEVLAVIVVVTLVYWASLNIKTHRTQAVTLVTVALLAIVVVMLSPGNGQRMTHQLSAHPYVWTAVVSVVQSLTWLVIWVPALLLATAIYLPLVGMKLAAMPMFDLSLRRYGAMVAVAVLLAHVPPTLGLSSVMIGRTAGVLYFAFIVYYFVGVTIVARRYRTTIDAWLVQRVTRVSMVAVALAFALVVVLDINSPVATMAVDAASGKAARYDRMLSDRVTAMSNAHEGDTLVFPALDNVPRSLYLGDLDADPAGLYYKAYADYYHCGATLMVEPCNQLYTSNYETLFNMGKTGLR